MKTQFYVVYKARMGDGFAEYEWKAPASALTPKAAERMFAQIFPDMEIVKTITREF